MLTGTFTLSLDENANIGPDNIFEFPSARSGLRKVWVLRAPTGFMNGHRRLDVVLVNPLKTRWISEADQKADRVNAKKLAQLLRVDMVAESYVPPDELR